MNALTLPAEPLPADLPALLPPFAVGKIAVLQAVAALPTATAAAIADRVAKPRTNVVRDLHKLEQHGLLTTVTGDVTADGRFVEIIATLTDLGQAEVVAQAKPIPQGAANPVRDAAETATLPTAEGEEPAADPDDDVDEAE